MKNIPIVAIVEKGVSIIDKLIGGYNERELQKIEIQSYEASIKAELKRLDLTAKIDRENSINNAKILDSIMNTITGIVRTDMELNIIQQQFKDARIKDFGDWIFNKKRDISKLRNEQLEDLRTFLKSSDTLHESDKIEFKKLAFQTIESNLKSITENDTFIIEQVKIKLSENDNLSISLKEELQKITHANIDKLLTENSRMIEKR